MSSASSSILALAWSRYLASLASRPLLTKCLTAAILSAGGEVLAQLMVPQRTRLRERVWRVFALGGYGIVWSGPSMHFFQRWLEAFTSRAGLGGTGLQTVLVKTLIDQLTYGPACSVTFLAWMHRVVDRLPGPLARYMWRTLPSVQITSWKVWPLASFVSYCLVPEDLRVVFMSGVSLAFTAALVLMTSPTRAKRHGAASHGELGRVDRSLDGAGSGLARGQGLADIEGSVTVSSAVERHGKVVIVRGPGPGTGH